MKNILRKLQANESLAYTIMACLRIYRELLSLTIFLRVHSNSKEVSYLSWQNTYPNLKTTCHIKLKFFEWTKLPENLKKMSYICHCAFKLFSFVSVTIPLIDYWIIGYFTLSIQVICLVALLHLEVKFHWCFIVVFLWNSFLPRPKIIYTMWTN